MRLQSYYECACLCVCAVARDLAIAVRVSAEPHALGPSFPGPSPLVTVCLIPSPLPRSHYYAWYNNKEQLTIRETLYCMGCKTCICWKEEAGGCPSSHDDMICYCCGCCFCCCCCCCCCFDFWGFVFFTLGSRRLLDWN